ncbi:hypothetical protein HaLaN_02579, partial [Haematococcus lacustris]
MRPAELRSQAQAAH